MSSARRRRRSAVKRETFRSPPIEITLSCDIALLLIHELADALRAPPGLVHADVKTVDGKRLIVSIAREGG